MKKPNLDALGMMNREMTNSLTSFKDPASFSLVMVSPVVPPREPEKSFRVNFHSRDRADRAKGTFKGLRKTSSTMMGSVGLKKDKEPNVLIANDMTENDEEGEQNMTWDLRT